MKREITKNMFGLMVNEENEEALQSMVTRFRRNWTDKNQLIYMIRIWDSIEKETVKQLYSDLGSTMTLQLSAGWC